MMADPGKLSAKGRLAAAGSASLRMAGARASTGALGAVASENTPTAVSDSSMAVEDAYLVPLAPTTAAPHADRKTAFAARALPSLAVALDSSTASPKNGQLVDSSFTGMPKVTADADADAADSAL